MKLNKLAAVKATISLAFLPLVGYVVINHPQILAGIFAASSVIFFWYICYLIFKDENK